MSITDELREYALGWDERNRVRRDLTAIADRIDAEHEKCIDAMWEDAKSHLGEESLTEQGWIRLPKDADGEPIHIGDEMCGYGWPNGGVYCRAIVNEVTILVGPQDGAYRGWLMWAANEFHHHHAQTVEDVLRDVVTLCHNTWKEGSAFEFYDVDDVMKSGNIADYAAKLRLAEGEDA